MVTRIQRWGNSLGLRIPSSFAAETKVRAGSMVDLSVESGKLVVRPLRAKRYELRSLLRQIRPDTIHKEILTGEPVGREGW